METINEKISAKFDRNETKKVDKKISVFGMFTNRAELEDAIDDLKSAGFRDADISALLPDPNGSKALAHEKGTKAPEGAAAGATAGGVIGGTLGVLAGVGMLAIPGLGPFIAAGPIMAALAGIGVGGAVGTVAGALIGMGIPEYEAKRFETALSTGGLLLSVHADDRVWADRAQSIIKRAGAQDISKAGEASDISSHGRA